MRQFISPKIKLNTNLDGILLKNQKVKTIMQNKSNLILNNPEKPPHSFQDRVDSLRDSILTICDSEDHGGVVICAIMDALSIQLHGMIKANDLNREQAIEQILKDIKENMEDTESLDRDVKKTLEYIEKQKIIN